MLTRLLGNLRHPKGFLGALLARMMNVGHGPMTQHVLRHLGIKEGDLALDIGCGGGEAIARMAAAGAIVYGVDLSPTSVRVARAKNRAAIAEGRVRIEQANVDALPFGENMFDWVTAFETVYFWDNIQTNFSHILRALKPGGHFAVVLEAYRENGETKNFPALFSRLDLTLYSLEDLRGFAETAGFEETSSFKGGKSNWLCFFAESSYKKGARL